MRDANRVEPAETPAERPARGMTAATAALVLVTLVVAVAGEPLVAYAERAATDLLQPGAYRTLVLGVGP